MQSKQWLVLATLTALTASAAVVTAQPTRSAYDQLDSAKLAEKLTAMGMKQLSLELQRTTALKDKTALELMRMAAASGDMDFRENVIELAVGKIAAQLAALGQSDVPSAVITRFKLQAQQVQALTMRADFYAQRILLLQDGPEDRARVVELTKSLDKVSAMSDKMQQQIEKWSNSADRLERIATGEMEELRNTQGLVQFQLGWLLLYRGMAMEKPTDRPAVLDQARAAVVDFADATDNDKGVKYISQLMVGMGFRATAGALVESKADKTSIKSATTEAERYIKAAMQPDPEVESDAGKAADKDRIKKAKFEMARLLTETGRYEDAVKALDEYATYAQSLVPADHPQWAVEGDLLKGLLANRLYEAWAKDLETSNPAKARECLAKAQDALVQFNNKYPKESDLFFQIIARGYRQRTDYENFCSMLLWAVARESAYGGEAGKARAKGALAVLTKKTGDPVLKQYQKEIGDLDAMLSAEDDPGQAGKKYMEMAKAFLKDGKKKDALDNASNAVFAYFRAMEKTPSPQLRQQYIEAMEFLTANTASKSDPLVAQWWVELARQYRALAEEAAQRDNPADQQRWLEKSIAATGNVPKQGLPWVQARYQEIVSRFDLLDLMPATAAAAKQEAGQKLVADCEVFANDVVKAVKESPKEAAILNDWGSDAEYRAAQVLYLKDPAKGLELLESLPAKWPNTPVLENAAQFKISKLVEAAQLDQALEAVRKFEQAYPGHGVSVIEMVLKGLQDKIRGTSADDAKRATYVKAYVDFTKTLLEDAKKRNDDLAKLAAAKQNYADALRESGKAAEALAIFDELARDQEKIRAAKLAEISKTAVSLNDELDKCQTDAAKVLQKAKDFRALLKQLPNINVDAMTFLLTQAEKSYGEAKPDDKADRDYRLKTLVDTLRAQYRQYPENAKRMLGVDFSVLLGQARCHRTLKTYDKALLEYDRLKDGVRREQNPKLYWQMQLEYAQTYMDTNSGNPSKLRGLRFFFETMRAVAVREQDPTMSGLAGKFEEVEANFAKLTGSSATKTNAQSQPG